MAPLAIGVAEQPPITSCVEERARLMAVKVDSDKCNGCGPCEEACAVEAIKVTDNLAVVDADACIDCGACIDACPNEAISEG